MVAPFADHSQGGGKAKISKRISHLTLSPKGKKADSVDSKDGRS